MTTTNDVRERLAAPAPAETGVIVGRRTVAEGITEHPIGDPACFLPGAFIQVYVVAHHMLRKPVACLPEQLERIAS